MPKKMKLISKNDTSNSWIGIPDDIEEYQGFVYLVTNLKNGMYYYGKKNFWSRYRKKLARKPTKVETERLKRYELKNIKKFKEYKKELKKKYKGKKVVSRHVKESDWKSYYGSSKWLLQDIEKYGYNNFKREIIHLCKTKTEMSWKEMIEQVNHNVLEDDTSYNGIIAIKLNRTK